MKETTKARKRRRKDKFWEQVFLGSGIDIGSGDDPFLKDWWPNVEAVEPFDQEHGDANAITKYVKPGQYDFVHSSNCLEHMTDPFGALSGWFMLLKPGGHLVFTVPDEDLYEQGVFPSRWNGDHKKTFTLWKKSSWSEKSVNVLELISSLPGCQVRRLEMVDTDYDYTLKDVDQTMNDAEAFIEVVLRKASFTANDTQTATFKHSGARGDIIYALPTIKALGGGVLQVNLSDKHYVGASMSQQDVESLKELLKDVDYVTGVEEWTGDPVTYDLDNFRDVGTDVNLLTRCHLDRFGVDFDLSQPWLDVEPNHIADIVMNRSPRYHGHLRWQELRGLHESFTQVFVGFEDEHQEFVKQTGLDVPLHTPETWAELAAVIKGSKLFIGNQSFPYSLAEAMKVPRVLEVCPQCPNCDPQSDNGYIRLEKDIIDKYIRGYGVTLENGPERRMSHSPRRRREPITSAGMRGKTKPLKDRPLVSVLLPWTELPGDAELSSLANSKSVGELVFYLPHELDARSKLDEIFKDQIKWRLSTVHPYFDWLGAVNRAAEESTGEILCLVKEGTVFSHGWAESIVETFKDNVGVVAPQMILSPEPHVNGSYIAMSRRAYEEVGFFNQRMVNAGCLELELCLRLKERRYSFRQVESRIANHYDGVPVSEADQLNEAYIQCKYGVKI